MNQICYKKIAMQTESCKLYHFRDRPAQRMQIFLTPVFNTQIENVIISIL